MITLGDNVDEPAVGGDGRVRRPRAALVALGFGAVVVALLGTATVPAFASAAPATSADTARPVVEAGRSPSTSDGVTLESPPSPTSTPVPQNQLAPAPGTPTAEPAGPPVRPVIDDPGDVTSSTVRLSGTGTAGHLLRVTSSAAAGLTGCSTTVRPDGSWACIATVRSGPQQVFTVRDATAPSIGTGTTPASDVIVPPVVTTSRPTSGPVSGRGYAGSTIALSVAGSTTALTGTVGPDGLWTVSLRGAVPRGDAQRTVTATQTGSTADGFRSELRSAASTPVTVVVDRTAPAAPRITAPGSGARLDGRPTTVSGIGEPGDVLTVYVDHAPVCRTVVRSSGGWSCPMPGQVSTPGSHVVTANQQDTAGNFSKDSAAVRVVVQPTTGSPSGSPVPPGTPASSVGPTGYDGPTDASTPTSAATTAPNGADGGSGGGTGGTGGAGTGGGTGGAGSASGGGRHLDWTGPAGDWAASTAYDSTVPTIQTAFSWRTVLVATALAAGFLALVAGPLAFVAGAARGRLRSPFAGLLGRNRSREERRHGNDVLPTWAAITTAVVVVAFSTVLGVGISLEARYVRLAVAVLLGAAVLTTTVVLASRWAAGADRHTTGFRVSPWLVLAALVACCVTRSFELSPALVVGTVLVPVGRPRPDTAGLRLGSAIASGARSATWRSVALLAVAAAGWVLHSLTPGSGLWVSFVSEFATTLCVGGLGAVVVTMLPMTGSAGQTLLAHSAGRYVAIVAVAVALAAAVYSGPAGVHAPPLTLLVAATACTAGALAVLVRQRLAPGDRRV